MLSNSFWERVVIGAGLIFSIYLVAHLFDRLRAKDDANSKTTRQP